MNTRQPSVTGGSMIAWCLLFGTLTASAQPVSPPAALEPEIVTNRDAFIGLDSPLKKTEPSTRWQTIRGDLLGCSSNILVVRTFAWKNIYGPVPSSNLPGIGNSFSHLYDAPALRPVIGRKKQTGPVVAIRNYSATTTFTNGQEIVCSAMVTGTYSWEASLIELYDCLPRGVAVEP